MSEHVFDVVSEHEEIEHVPQKVNPGCVHEHRRDKRVQLLPVQYLGGDQGEVVVEELCEPIVEDYALC